MDLREYVLALRKRWPVIVALTVIGGFLAYAYAHSLTPVYKARADVYVSLNGGQTAGDFVQGSTYVQNSIQSFVQLANMPIVLNQVVDELGLDRSVSNLSGSVSASNPLNTFIIQVAVTDSDPRRAALVANSVAAHLGSTVHDLSPTIASGAKAVSVSTIAPATPPKYPFKPNKRFIVAGGLALGLACGLVLALSAAALDTRVRTTADVAKLSSYPVLGTILRARDGRSARTTMLQEPHSARAEGFRRIQTNLQYLDTENHIKSIVITSSVAAEGKTTMAINLALTVAEKGTSVLLVDADLRRPALADALGMESAAGLTTILIGRAVFEDVVQPWGHENLHVLTSGELPPNPSQLLDSEAMHELIRTATKVHDLIIFDTAPVLPVVDASVLGRATDGVLMVVSLRKVRRQQVRSALDSVEVVGTRILGLVASGAKDGPKSSSYAYVSRPDSTRWQDRRKRRNQKASVEPVAEEPEAARPVAEGRGAEVPTKDEPVAEAPVVEGPGPEVPAEEEPVADALAAERPGTEGPADNQPVTDAPVPTVRVGEKRVPVRKVAVKKVAEK